MFAWRFPQFVQSGPEWLALLLQVLVPPFALFRALWEAAQWAFLADSSGGHGERLWVRSMLVTMFFGKVLMLKCLPSGRFLGRPCDSLFFVFELLVMPLPLP